MDNFLLTGSQYKPNFRPLPTDSIRFNKPVFLVMQYQRFTPNHAAPSQDPLLADIPTASYVQDQHGPEDDEFDEEDLLDEDAEDFNDEEFGYDEEDFDDDELDIEGDAEELDFDDDDFDEEELGPDEDLF